MGGRSHSSMRSHCAIGDLWTSSSSSLWRLVRGKFSGILCRKRWCILASEVSHRHQNSERGYVAESIKRWVAVSVRSNIH